MLTSIALVSELAVVDACFRLTPVVGSMNGLLMFGIVSSRLRFERLRESETTPNSKILINNKLEV